MHWVDPYVDVPDGQLLMHWVDPYVDVPDGQLLMHCAGLPE
jgi:hypothetical protein